MIDQLLKGNKKFRETVFRLNIDHYQELAKGQSPPVLWIGCSDSRLQTGHITGTGRHPVHAPQHRQYGSGK